MMRPNDQELTHPLDARGEPRSGAEKHMPRELQRTARLRGHHIPPFQSRMNSDARFFMRVGSQLKRTELHR